MVKTTSLETSKLLKEAGFRQEKIEFYWLTTISHKYILNQEIPNSEHETSFLASHDDHRRWTMKEFEKNYAAPTTDELLEELPGILSKEMGALGIWKTNDEYEVFYGGMEVEDTCKHKSLPEALAQMWLFLKKENLLQQER